jgi:predicted RNA polymerase sigma factor
LISIRPSPIVALNRAIAIGQRDGPGQGLKALGAIPDADRLANYSFYHAAFGEFELRRGRHKIATDHFLAARQLARNPMERQFFEQRMAAGSLGDSPQRQ